MKIKRVLIVLAVLLLCVSCTSIRVDFGNGFSFELLGFNFEYQFPVEEYQLISGSFPYIGENMVFESWTRVDGDCVNLVIFLPTGQTFAKIDWDGKKLTYDSAFMPMGKYFAQYIVNDLQMCYAPLYAIENNLYGSGVSIREERIGETCTRTIKKGSTIVETITIKTGLITVNNVLSGYCYEIETL